MSNRVRVADRLVRQSAEQIIVMADAVISGLTNNSAFPNPTVALKDLQAAADDLKAALAAQVHGGKAATAEKNNKREVLMNLLRTMKHYVEDNCGKDPAVLLSSGFQVASTNRASSPLANPSILNIDVARSTELVLKVTPIPRAKLYEVRMAPVNSSSGAGPWQNLGLFSSSKGITIGELTPGSTYAFQVRAVGGSTGYSEWSNSVSRMCL
jgi:hypothetical protein